MKALQNTAKIIHCQLCCSRWCRCPQVCYKIRNGKIRLMSHCRDHRCPALKNSTGNALLVKGPEIFNRATSTADDDHVHPCFIQHPDSLYDTLRRSLSLHKCRIKDHLQIWIPSACNITDILYCCTSRCCHHAKGMNKMRNGLLIFLGKHPHILKFLFQCQISFIEGTSTFQCNLFCIKLITPVSLIYVYNSACNYLIPVLHAKSKTPTVSRKHHTA